MKCTEIDFAHKQKPLKPLAVPRGGTICEDYFPVRRLLPKMSGGAPNRTAPPCGVTNIINNLRVVNNIALRVTLCSGGASLRGRLAHGGARLTTDFAGEIIDIALRDEVDRQLALLQRGENIAPNRRRCAMLERHLRGMPIQTIRYFYPARMRFISAAPGTEVPKDDFHSDILHEKHTETTRTTYERNSLQIIRQDTTPTREREESARQIAEQVFHRVERKLRLDRERLGFPR